MVYKCCLRALVSLPLVIPNELSTTAISIHISQSFRKTTQKEQVTKHTYVKLRRLIKIAYFMDITSCLFAFLTFNFKEAKNYRKAVKS